MSPMIDRYTDRLEKLLSDHLRSTLEGSGAEQVAIGYSGGLDCSVIARMCSRYKPVKLYVVGTGTSRDVGSAELGADILKLPLTKIEIDRTAVEAEIPRLIELLRTRNALEISIELSFYFLCRSVDEELIMTGQGADELFGGYSRYLRMGESERAEIMHMDTEKYLNHVLLQEQRLAGGFGKRLEPTYMCPGVIEFAGNLPMDHKICRGERKYILKELGRKLGLPAEIVNRPKKAVQYGSGSLAILKELAKERYMEIHEYLRSI